MEKQIVSSFKIPDLKNKDYYYIHHVCHYFGSTNVKKECLQVHAYQCQKMSKLYFARENVQDENQDILIIYSVMLDDTSVIPNIYDDLKRFEGMYQGEDGKTRKVDVAIAYWFNWGGTIGSMWLTWNFFLKRNNIRSKYICTFEDDHVFRFPSKWILEPIKMLEDDLIYVGMLPYCKIRNWNKLYKEVGYNYVVKEHIKQKNNLGYISEKYYKQKDMKWTAGGVYFMPFENLSKIEQTFGTRFIDKPYNCRYNRKDDGLLLGEVGFPTKLSLNGFKFKGIYTKHADNRSWITWLDTPHPLYGKWVKKDFEKEFMDNGFDYKKWV